MPDSSRPTPRAALTWLLAPATEDVPVSHARAARGLSLLLGLMWLYNVSWKRAPDFGQEAGNGLYKFTSYAVEHPVFPPYSWVVENLVLPNFTPFGWTVLLLESTLAILLLTGSWVRVAALLGLSQSLAIGLSVAYAPEEWPWSYWLMIGAHAVLLFSSAGRVFAVDAVRAKLATGRTLGTVFGGVAVLAGLYSLVLSFGDPLERRGPGLHSTDLSMSLGYYNLLGALVLIATGALVLLAARGAPPVLGLAAAALGVLAALLIHAQLAAGSDPLLGGNTTSATVLLSLAAVAGAIMWSAHQRWSSL